jgi:hypothetical protein
MLIAQRGHGRFSASHFSSVRIAAMIFTASRIVRREPEAGDIHMNGVSILGKGTSEWKGFNDSERVHSY